MQTVGATTTRCSYYYAGSQRVAMRIEDATSNHLYYLLTDHLGSTSVITDATGNVVARQGYLPFGGERYSQIADPNAFTSFDFTGQRLDGTGLHFYNARYYSSAIGRFVSADTLVPEPGNPQSLNRYSYVLNSPLRYTDPTGHCVFGVDTLVCLGVAAAGLVVALSVTPGDSRLYDAPPGNAVAFTGGMLDTLPHLLFGGCAASPDKCAQTAEVVAEQTRTTPGGAQVASAVGRAAEPAMGLSEKMVNEFARVSTVNPGSREVVLGLYKGGQGYTAMAEARGASYLNMPSDLWRVFQRFPGDFRLVNIRFLQIAMEQGKTFVLETPFSEAMKLTTTNLYMEIQYLLAHGYKLVNVNGVDQLVPK